MLKGNSANEGDHITKTVDIPTASKYKNFSQQKLN